MTDETPAEAGRRHADLAMADAIRGLAIAAREALSSAMPENQVYQDAFAGRLGKALDALERSGRYSPPAEADRQPQRLPDRSHAHGR